MSRMVYVRREKILLCHRTIFIVLKFGMTENLVTNLIAFALIGEFRRDDNTKDIWTTTSGATLSHNLICILVVIPYQSSSNIKESYSGKLKCIQLLAIISLILEIELEKGVVSQHTLK